MKDAPIIGVIGGMGPHAGLDLVRKIFDQTRAYSDHEHVPVAFLSYPGWIPDRSRFLFGQSEDNPAGAIAAIARRLEASGATIAGIPCNTAHAPAIFEAVQEQLAATGSSLRLLHLIEETVHYVESLDLDIRRVGILATLAVYRLKLYKQKLEAAGFDAVVPDETVQEQIVNRTIFDTEYGLKAQANPVSPKARKHLLQAIDHLREKGAQAVVLGCTELPLAITEPAVDSVRIVDPTVALARALLRQTYPDRLLAP